MGIVKQPDGNEYIDDVEFSAKLSEYDNCLCSCCHKSDYVIKLRYPITLYYPTGKKYERALSDKIQEIWICCDCINKCLDALRIASDNFRDKLMQELMQEAREREEADQFNAD